MNRLRDFASRYWPFAAWLLVVAVLFAPTAGLMTVLPSPDSSAIRFPSMRLELIEDLLAGTASLAPHDLLTLVFPHLWLTDASYLIDSILAAIGFTCFLCIRKMPPVAAILGGGVLAFAGYSFSLVSAGHRGFFFMLPYVVFMFAFIAKGVDSLRPVFFGLAACCAAWVIRFAPDVAPIFLGIAALYAVYALLPKWKSLRARHAVVCILVAIAAFALAAFPSIYNAATTLRSERKTQIEQSAKTDAEGTADPNAAWVFATNWSLPPDEIVEFIAPCFKGRQTGDPSAPYWGRLGQSYEWDKTHEGFPNFRQHTIYLGAIPVAFALLAVLAWTAARRKADGPAYIRDIPFFATLWIVALLLAFGRYAPFYRLFYAIPGMSLLRAPVKFMRVVEFSTAFLAAAGVASLLAPSLLKRDKLKSSAMVFGAAAAICAAAALAIHSSPLAFTKALADFGAPAQLQTIMADFAARSFLHPVIGFAIAAAVLFLASRNGANARLCAALVFAIAIDVTTVHKPFMGTYNVSDSYRDNQVVRTVCEKRPFGKSLGIFAEVPKWFRDSLDTHGVLCLPINDARYDHQAFLSATGNDVMRLMELSGGEFDIIPSEWLKFFPQGRAVVLSYLSFTQTSVSMSLVPTPIALVKMPGAVPFAKLYSDWATSPRDSWMQTLAGLPPTREIVADGAPAPTSPSSEPGEVSIISERLNGNHLKTIVSTSAKSEQLLTVWHSRWRPLAAEIDGNPAKVFEAGYTGYGVVVPAGEHTVAFHRPFRPAVFAASLAMLFAFFAGIFTLLRRHL